MTKKLLKNLFITFLFSTVLSIAGLSIYHAIIQKANVDYHQAITLIISAAFFLNLVIMLMASPLLLLSYPQYYNHKVLRPLLYFSGPVLFLIIIFISPALPSYYLVPGVMFSIVHSWFYYKLVREN